MKPIPTETATDVGSVGKWLGAAAAGALLMYLLDPERGAARRSRALSAARSAGARTGASVDHALHSAGDALLGLKDSAASVLARGADRVQAQAAPAIERARDGVHGAVRRAEAAADHWRHSTYESSRDYAPGARTGRGPGEWLRSLAGRRAASDRDLRNETVRADDGPHPALVGGGILGMLSVVRRSPTGLLVGLAALAFLMRGAGSRTYRVADNMAMPRPHARDAEQESQAPLIPPSGEAGSRYLH